MPLRCGQTVLLGFPPGTPMHLHIVLTDSFGDPPAVIMVYVSTSRGRRHEDPHLILSEGDHPFLTRDSYVVFDQAKPVSVAAIEKLIDSGRAVIRDDASPDLMARAREKMLTSTRVPMEVKAKCRKLWS